MFVLQQEQAMIGMAWSIYTTDGYKPEKLGRAYNFRLPLKKTLGRSPITKLDSVSSDGG